MAYQKYSLSIFLSLALPKTKIQKSYANIAEYRKCKTIAILV